MKRWVRTEDFRKKVRPSRNTGHTCKDPLLRAKGVMNVIAYGVITENRPGVSPPKTVFREHSIGRV